MPEIYNKKMQYKKYNYVFYLVFYIILSCHISVDPVLALDKDSEDVNSQQQDADQDSLPISETSLHRNAFSNNTSELFAKVVDMEEQLRNLNGRLENAEHLNLKLTKQLSNLQVKLDSINNKDSMKGNSNQMQPKSSRCPNATPLKYSINLIKAGKNSDAVTLLEDYLKKVKAQNKQLYNEGEVYYWLGKAYLNQKSSDKASYYFTKSYKYYSNIKLNDILIELVDALKLSKKYTQICLLLNKLDARYLNSLSKNKQNEIKNIKNTNCKSYN